jgi:hypothetical protein
MTHTYTMPKSAVLLILNQERSSSKRKEMWRIIQIKADNGSVLQRILDMKVRWSSTYLMLDRVEKKKDVRCEFQTKISITHTFRLGFGSLSMLLLMNFDGKNKTLPNVIRFGNSSSQRRSGFGLTLSLAC